MNRKIYYLVLFLGLIILLFIPESVLFGNKQTVCIHKSILGFECPLCGLSRAGYKLVHFDFKEAFYYNFNIYLIALLIIIESTAYYLKIPMLKMGLRITAVFLLLGLLTIYVLRIVRFF